MRGISLAAVRDNQRNGCDDGGDFWTYAFRDVVKEEVDNNRKPSDLTYNDLFTKMKTKYYIYPVRPTPSTYPAGTFSPTCEDPVMSYDPEWINPNQKFLAPLP